MQDTGMMRVRYQQVPRCLVSPSRGSLEDTGGGELCSGPEAWGKIGLVGHWLLSGVDFGGGPKAGQRTKNTGDLFSDFIYT